MTLGIFNVTLLAAGAVLSHPNATGADSVRIPFGYRGAAVGGGVVQAVILDRGGEGRVISRLIVSGFQERNLSVAPENPNDNLRPGKRYKTDTAPVSDADIIRHNQENVALTLDPSYRYGIQFDLSYALEDRDILIRAKPILFYRGSGSRRWHEYKKDYSGAFFLQPVLASIRAAGERLANPQRPAP